LKKENRTGSRAGGVRTLNGKFARLTHDLVSRIRHIRSFAKISLGIVLANIEKQRFPAIFMKSGGKKVFGERERR
jgi:hypothetical protein